jgi:phage recombination protein Bet
MAARTISMDELGAAVKEYAARHELTMSSNEKGFCLMPGDTVITLQDGKPSCSNAEILDSLVEILMDMAEEPARAPQKPNLPARPANTKAAQRRGQDGPLTKEDIINYINPKATPQEAYLFAEFCKRKGADPLTKQVYLVIYEGQNGRQANFIAGKEYFTEKAEAHPQLDGFQAGIIVRKKESGELERRIGTFWLHDEEQLLGGWAEVTRKDRTGEYRIEVPLSDYDTKKNLWVKMPATMIRKVALVQVLREAFPGTFGGLYDRSEMDQAMDVEYEVGA